MANAEPPGGRATQGTEYMCAQDSVSRSRRGVNTEAVAAGNESPKAIRSGWLSSTGRNGFGKVPGIPLAPRAG